MKKELLKEMYDQAATNEEKRNILEKLLQCIDEEKADAARDALLASYRNIICAAINTKAGSKVAKDDRSMFENLALIARNFVEPDGYVTTILPVNYGQMLVSILVGSIVRCECEDPKISDSFVDVRVRLIAEDGRIVGTAIQHRAIDRKNPMYDRAEQDALAVSFAIGKAKADAYRDAGIGIFKNGPEDEFFGNGTEITNPAMAEIVNKVPVAAEKPAKKKEKTADNPAKTVSEPAKPQEEIPVFVPDGIVKEVPKETSEMPVKGTVLPIPDGYPTLEEALQTKCKFSDGGMKTYGEMQNPKAPVLAYCKLKLEAEKEGTAGETPEMKAVHVIIASNFDFYRAECIKKGIADVFEK